MKKKSSRSAKSGRSQSQKPAGNRNEEDRKHLMSNGSNVIASSREEDISGTSSNTWLDADQLRGQSFFGLSVLFPIVRFLLAFEKVPSHNSVSSSYLSIPIVSLLSC